MRANDPNPNVAGAYAVETAQRGGMSESVVFELKLQIQHLEEKLTFLAGGTNGAELVEVLMEKDEELEKNVRVCACLW